MPSLKAPDTLNSAPQTQYDALLVNPANKTALTPEELAQQLADVDVVVVGEYHGHHGSHLLQSRLQSALFRLRPEQILSMEQFNLDRQDELNRYLRGETGETEMIENGIEAIEKGIETIETCAETIVKSTKTAPKRSKTASKRSKTALR